MFWFFLQTCGLWAVRHFFTAKGKPLLLKWLLSWRTCTAVSFWHSFSLATIWPAHLLFTLICYTQSCEEPPDLGLTPILFPINLAPLWDQTSLSRVFSDQHLRGSDWTERSHMVQKTPMTCQVTLASLILLLSFTWECGYVVLSESSERAAKKLIFPTCIYILMTVNHMKSASVVLQA